MLDLILNQEDPERAFVTFKNDDELVLLVNNQGGMSELELGAIVDEVLTQLGQSSPTHPNSVHALHSVCICNGRHAC